MESKGQKFREWSIEEKLRIVKRHTEDHVSVRQLSKEEGATDSMICRWVQESGEEGFQPKKRGGNPYAALNTSKSLTKIERLRLLAGKTRNRNRTVKKRVLGGRSWCKQGVRYRLRQEYEIAQALKVKYPVSFLLKMMDINPSGYYKWLKRAPNRYEQNRLDLTTLLLEQSKRHKSWGYHRLAATIRKETSWLFSDNLTHKCCKSAGIRSRARSYHYRKAGTESIRFPNLVKGNWNADRPLSVVVSDMTCIRNKGMVYEWTLLLDTFNNGIAHGLSRNGDNALLSLS
jgi:transposase-like protein